MSAERFELIAVTAFGLEAVAKREIEALGFPCTIASTGRLELVGDHAAVALLNVRLRTVGRLLIRAAQFPAADFEQLFEGCRSLPWGRWIPRDAAFPVNGRSVKSALTSVPAVQRATKRAIVDALMRDHRTASLPETGPRVLLEVSLLNDVATITIDTSGDGLHKRGYRTMVGAAGMKETLAAALVMLSAWEPRRPLVDPFCGTGTIAIEAAMLARNIAPGIRRSFDAEQWADADASLWEDARAEARELERPAVPVTIHASDIDERALSMARAHAQAAGVERDIHFIRRDFADLASKAEYGCIITNPPYGERLGDPREVEALYRAFPLILRRLPTWSFFVLTARPDFESLVGAVAARRRKLFNAEIECTYYQFLGPKPPWMSRAAPDEPAGDGAEPGEPFTAGEHPASEPVDESRTPPRPSFAPVFAGMRDRDRREIEQFRATLTNNARHLRRYPSRGIFCYRVYEKDAPDVPLIVDRYEDWAHVFEHEREHSRTASQQADWLDACRDIIAEVLEIPHDHVVMKMRLRQRGLTQHEKLGDAGPMIEAREGGLKFLVNLTDYTDTGLFLDHRVTRDLFRARASGERVLNLFAYTGAFSVYAAAGGADRVTTVDLSNTYLGWAKRNFEINAIDPARHRFVRADARRFLAEHPRGTHYELVVCDPPTFSNSTATERDWDVQRDHAELINAITPLVAPGGEIWFSNNFRRFKLDEAALVGVAAREISRRTIPPEYRNTRIHRCWVLRVNDADTPAS